MTDLATVRAEVKAWERSFKEHNGRAATVDDIKKNSAIAEKYKLYKKLSKAAVALDAPKKEKTPPRPSTPSRSARHKDPTSILLSRPRVVQPTGPLTAFNPFSPRKSGKGKERETSPAEFDVPRRNLFGKAHSISSSQDRSTSPDPFPMIQRSQPSSSTSSSDFPLPLPAAPTTAVSRARKRLRGEPVSPSPNKEKRRRVTSQTVIPFLQIKTEAPTSDDEMDVQDADSSFLDNSPIKAPTSGKLFPQLFEESVLAPVDLFGIKSKLGIADTDKDDPPKLPRKVGNITRAQKTMPKPARSSSSSALLGRGDQRDKGKGYASISRSGSEAQSESSTNRSSVKRVASDDEPQEIDQPVQRSKSPLLPPSPPATGTSAMSSRPSKGPSKSQIAAQSRKKAKIEEQTGTSDSEGLESTTKLKIVKRNNTSIRRADGDQEGENGVEFDSDPVLGYARFAGPRAPSPNTTQQQEGSYVDVNLPDELRRVLALESAAPQSQFLNEDEDELAKGLIYGRRTTHYDSSRGGEIWDIGEDHYDEEGNRHTEGEEDWEGEPVPWEVAEL